jgi:predicted transcriptional regulator of viral defense system
MPHPAADVLSVSSAERRFRTARPQDVVSEIADRQYGLITTRQLEAAGLSSPAIRRRVEDGRLRRLYRGVYAVGHRALVPNGFWLAAVLACGPGAVLSHRSAAAAWDLRRTGRGNVDVTAPSGAGRKRKGIDVHVGLLPQPDVTTLDGLPITTPARTLLDLAEVVPRDHLRRALEQAIRLRLHDERAAEDVLDRATGRRGARPLTQVLDALRPEHLLTRSELERVALDVIGRHDLPMPEVNQRLHGYEVDLLWRAQRVVVELDGYAFHTDPTAFEADRRRDGHLQARGYRVQRFTWRQIDTDPAWIAATLEALLAAS